MERSCTLDEAELYSASSGPTVGRLAEANPPDQGGNATNLNRCASPTAELACAGELWYNTHHSQENPNVQFPI